MGLYELQRKLVDDSVIEQNEDVKAYETTARLYNHQEPCANQAFNGVIRSDEDFRTLIKICGENLCDAEKPMHEKTMAKWITQQGGYFTKDLLVKNLLDEDGYYHVVEIDPDIIREIRYDAGHWFIRHEKDVITFKPDSVVWDYRVGSKNRGKLYLVWKAKKSNGGILGYCDRRTPGFAAKAVAWAVFSPTNYDKLIGGMRYKDSKYRNIFNDGFGNYFREVIAFGNMFAYWEQWQMDKHEAEIQTAAEIVLCASQDSYAADYKAMDMHLGIDAARETAMIMCDVLHATPEERSFINMSIEEMFYAPLLVADEIWYGLHNLFSGIYPTHDLEGILNFSIQCYTAHKQGFVVVPKPRRLKRNEVFIKVCGDDSFVLFGRKLSSAEREAFGVQHALASKACGEILELSKVEWSSEFVTFCKNTYALNRSVKGYKKQPVVVLPDGTEVYDVPVPKYSAAKACNALRHPESIPHFPYKSDLIIWMCSILDCAYGTRQWAGVVNFIAAHNSDLFGDPTIDWNNWTISEETRAILREDWWFDHYANFDLPKSPTFQLLKRLLGK